MKIETRMILPPPADSEVPVVYTYNAGPLSISHAAVIECCRKVAGIRPIPHLNFYHRCRLRVCRWFGLLTDWIWEIKDKKGR